MGFKWDLRDENMIGSSVCDFCSCGDKGAKKWTETGPTTPKPFLISEIEHEGIVCVCVCVCCPGSAIFHRNEMSFWSWSLLSQPLKSCSVQPDWMFFHTCPCVPTDTVLLFDCDPHLNGCSQSRRDGFGWVRAGRVFTAAFGTRNDLQWCLMKCPASSVAPFLKFSVLLPVQAVPVFF